MVSFFNNLCLTIQTIDLHRNKIQINQALQKELLHYKTAFINTPVWQHWVERPLLPLAGVTGLFKVQSNPHYDTPLRNLSPLLMITTVMVKYS